ncbi:MAG: class I SAM-dependent methyltransferase [Candidatus Bathyarchaeota archaeon]|jgi:ubiquinone/menaquinone biosynthesis C-methylase UbiE
MRELYATPQEYEALFTTLTRPQVASKIKLGNEVLDIAAGSAYFSIEVAIKHPSVKITAVDIFQGSVDRAGENIAARKLDDRITAIRMDASDLDFPDQCFDTVVNYLGFEDIHMTRGYGGVQKAIREVGRVLRPQGTFYFVAMPPDMMETEPQRLEVELFSWLCGATWLKSDEYISLLEEAGLVFRRKTPFYTGKKLTVDQAKEEIEYACEYAPIHYNVETSSFREAWEKFGESIQRHGLGHYSKTVLFEAEKR